MPFFLLIIFVWACDKFGGTAATIGAVCLISAFFGALWMMRSDAGCAVGCLAILLVPIIAMVLCVLNGTWGGAIFFLLLSVVLGFAGNSIFKERESLKQQW